MCCTSPAPGQQSSPRPHCDGRRYRQEVFDSLVGELNRVYELFVCRNPRFLPDGGKASFLCHSLGSVMTFELLSHQVRGMRVLMPLLTWDSLMLWCCWRQTRSQSARSSARSPG